MQIARPRVPWWVPCILATVLSLAPAVAEPPGKSATKPDKEIQEYFEALKVFADTLDQIDRNYVREVSRRELVEAAIEGMLRRLDQYSDYIPPQQLARFRAEMGAEFGGIGLRVTTEERGYLEVISPFHGTPAHRAGILAGDRILRINGKATRTMSYSEAVRLLKGKPGSPIHLTVLHFGSKKPNEISLRRELIRIKTVLGHERKSDGSWAYRCPGQSDFGYVRLTGFGKTTAGELKAVLRQLTREGMKGLVLDLRFNPGGLLSAAIDVSDLLVAKGTIVSTQGRNVKSTTWEAHKKDTFEGFPVVVLVNRFTASASEIVAACLQDHRRAVVVGERTWGKGSVQNVISLQGGKSAVKLTTASYHRPSGKNIHRFPDANGSDDWGVRPNKGMLVRLTIPETQRLEIHGRQLKVIARKQPGSAAPSFEDRQLNRAVLHLRGVNKKARPTARPSSATKKRVGANRRRRRFKRE